MQHIPLAPGQARSPQFLVRWGVAQGPQFCQTLIHGVPDGQGLAQFRVGPSGKVAPVRVPLVQLVAPPAIVRGIRIFVQVVPVLFRRRIPVILAQGQLVKLRNFVGQPLHILPIHLLPHLLGVGVPVAPGQGRRLSHGVLHGLFAHLGVPVFVLLIQGIPVHIVLKGLPVGNALHGLVDLLLVLALVVSRPCAQMAVQCRLAFLQPVKIAAVIKHQLLLFFFRCHLPSPPIGFGKPRFPRASPAFTLPRRTQSPPAPSAQCTHHRSDD